MADHPDNDASSAAIARWMEEDFGEALADGVEETVNKENTPK